MEFMPQDLYDLLHGQPGRVVADDVSLKIWNAVMAGLQSIHASGTMHRDIHVGNILVRHTASSQIALCAEHVASVKIADFGKAVKMRVRVGACAPPPTYTAHTTAAHHSAPEVLFRHGTRWNNSGHRWPGSQVEQHCIMSAPPYCSYDGRVDIWACGILFLMMSGGPVYDTNSNDAVALEMIKVFGKIPGHVATRERWSVPPTWSSVQARGSASSQMLGSACSQMLKHPKLRFKSAAGPLGPQIQHALRALSYDPDDRPVAPWADAAR
jgi:serine/threonine protein kinase